MDVDKAFALIARAIDSGRAAHGYLIAGDLSDCCRPLVLKVLGKLFPQVKSESQAFSHPDVFSLSPSGRSRTVKMARTSADPSPGMLDAIVAPMRQSSYSGGWKVGVVNSAERMQPAAANAFLKLLEEPPAKSMFLLTTDQPDMLMPTIVSRVQRIDLPLPERLLQGDAREELDAVFGSRVENGFYAKSCLGAQLAEILAAAKDQAEDEDVPLVRKAFFRTIIAHARRWMVEGRLPMHVAMRNIESVEDAYRQSNNSMPDDFVMTNLAERIVFPQ